MIDFFLNFVAFAKFLLNGLHLLAQVELALALVHLATSLRIDIVLDLEDLDFLRHQGMNTAQPLDRIDEFKHFLRLIDFQIEIRCDQIRQPGRVVQVGSDRYQIRRDVFSQRNHLLE